MLNVRSLAPLWAVGSAALALATWVCFQVGLNSATTGYVFLIIIVLLSIMDSLISSIFFSVIAVGVASRYHGRGARGRHLASGGVSDGQAKRGTTEQHENHIGGPY